MRQQHNFLAKLNKLYFHLWYPISITLIVLIAAGFRLFQLHDLPPGLARDEALNADIVESIWQGNHAFFFREGYGHEPLYHYLGVPFQQLIGDNFLAIRLPSVFLGLILLALVARWARRDYGELTSVIATLILAVSWWAIIFSRVGLRPILLPVLLVLALYWWFNRPILAGLSLGLSFYSYTAARVLILIPCLFLAYQFLPIKHKEDTKRFRSKRKTLLILLITMLVGFPLLYTVWQDPTLDQRVRQLSGPLEALQQGSWRPLLENAWRVLGVFGWTGDPLSSYGVENRPIFPPLSTLLFYSGLCLTLARTRHPRAALISITFATTLLPSILAQDAPSLIRLIGAMPLAALFPALALDTLKNKKIRENPRHPRHPRSILFSILLIIMFSSLTSRTLNEGFQQWAQQFDTRFKYQSIWLDISRHLGETGTENIVISDGWYEPVKADTVWRNWGQPLDTRWVQQGRAMVVPAAGGYLYVPEFMPVNVGVLEMVGISAETLHRSTQKPTFALYTIPPPTNNTHSEVSFNDALTLIDYQWQPDQSLITVWQVQNHLPWDLSSFVHLYSGETLITQHDGFDAAPATIQIGDTIYQHHLFDWSQTSPDQITQVNLGIYQTTTEQRWRTPNQDYTILNTPP